jgi:hypothetical protein
MSAREFFRRAAFPAWVAVGIIVGTLNLRGAVRPDYDEAVAFAGNLQRDYAKRGPDALVEKLDADALRFQIFDGFDRGFVESDALKELVNTHCLPGLAASFRAYTKSKTFFCSRIVLQNDSRSLECILIAPDGSTVFLTLLLAARDGKIVIKDCEFWGQGFYARYMRQIFLVSGGMPGGMRLEAEDYDHYHEGRHVMLTVQTALDAFGRNDFPAAANIWMKLPEEFQALPFWRNFRDRLAAMGEPRAVRSVDEENRSGHRSNSYLSYMLALREDNLPAALVALDAVLVDRGNPPVLRAAKAYWLVKTGRSAEALALSRDVFALNPRLLMPYLHAIRAAIALNQPKEAVDTLNHWAQVWSLDEIEEILKAAKETENFIETATYRDWKASVKGSTPSSP